MTSNPNATKLATKLKSTAAISSAETRAKLPFFELSSYVGAPGKDQFHTSNSTESGLPDEPRKPRAVRTSRSITLKQAQNVLDAVAHAERIGLRLNRFCTINWELAGVDDPIAATGQFCKLAIDMLRRYGGTAYVWVQENGDVMGRHVHILMHVPAAAKRAFARMPSKWVRRCGGTTIKGVTKTLRVHGHDFASIGDDSEAGVHTINLDRLVEYILKAANQKARAKLGLRWPPQMSVVAGKRTGNSQNLGAKARAKYSASTALRRQLDLVCVAGS